ncbi:MAG: aspartate carbamoyltransferase regulatory subunit [Clostridiales bacterium]|jgi:aspartate carbamoyltransferase regulatory subunit|nr:aspartate carbamoyltransferase regulatory subunit [Clostridiales bacterium]
MLSIDSIEKGVVIDHIKAGKAMQIYSYLNLDVLDCSVAVIKNAKSAKLGKKDIIKIEDRIDVDLNILGYMDPNITVNVIEGGMITSKLKLTLPDRLVNVIKCKNPRCVTSIEQEIAHVFKLSDKQQKVYRCVYCEQEQK